MQVVRKWPAAWPLPLAERWIEAVGLTLETLGSQQGPDSAVKAAVKHFALHAPPALAPDVKTRWLDDLDVASPWYAMLAEAVSMLNLRRRIHDAVP